jgi:hypothetical protein
MGSRSSDGFGLIAVSARTCGRRHFYGPLPFGSLRAAKSDRLLDHDTMEARVGLV